MYKRQTVAMEYIEDSKKTYSANILVDGEPLKGLPENVNWWSLQQAIKAALSEQFCICHLLHTKKQLCWELQGERRFAKINGCT